jgi:transposase
MINHAVIIDCAHIKIYTTEEINKVVDVSVDIATRRFICTFTNNQDLSEKSCSITLYRDCKEQDVLTTQANSTDSQIILVVGSLESDSSVYCYVVTASNDTSTININGTIGQSKPKPLNSYCIFT